MSTLRFDRLTLRLRGVSVSDGRRLAFLVANCLAAEDVPLGVRAAERMRLSIETRPGESLESMAERIAAQLTAATRGA